ncbi:MAG: hypothetical protein A2W00_13195 [Candidatus Eisenbacteria bacterium RBG_16_71_46]|nr:MAG: hypothetical protein A2W00_13195 [Candidatus Eisenbacteria bacterium RBG_16_71_46]
MRHSTLLAAPVLMIALALLAGPTAAQSPLGMPALGAYSPRVPVTGLGLASWFDPSRLHLSTSVSVGTGFGGGAQGLQVTSLNYQFRAPMTMSVSLGNALGGPAGARGSSIFLEGLRMAYQPSPSMLFQIRYQDLRSPLQYQSSPYDPFRFH